MTAEGGREVEWHSFGSSVRHIPAGDPPPLAQILSQTPPSHQNSSLPFQLSSEHKYHPRRWLWSKLLAPFLCRTGRNSNVNRQGRGVYSHSHPCLPAVYLYLNILSTRSIIWWMLQTSMTPINLLHQEHQQTHFTCPARFTVLKSRGLCSGEDKQTTSWHERHNVPSQTGTHTAV